MAILYRFILSGYGFLIHVASLVNPKARLWVRGRKKLFYQLQQKEWRKNSKTVWFHCASLGEFEQGRPVMESLREKKQNLNIVLSFFSPSGFEVRKNYSGADIITYLPLDTPGNAEKFIDIVKPDVAVFVKYEYWYFFLKTLYNRKIPVFLISALFRPGQLFFKKYGRFYEKMLHYFSKIFVQDPESKMLLEKHGVFHTEVSGDTRYDRVIAVASKPKNIPLADKFTSGHPTIVAGSTWPLDEKLLIAYIINNERPFRWIIAPHEITPGHVETLTAALGEKAILFSAAEQSPDLDVRVLIIDNVGMLSSLYALANIAYIGGGFGKGIHNILEAAVYGIPVLFGPRYQKFREARELVALETAFPITNYNDLTSRLNFFFDQPETRKKTGRINREIVHKKRGATEQIVNNLLMII